MRPLDTSLDRRTLLRGTGAVAAAAAGGGLLGACTGEGEDGGSVAADAGGDAREIKLGYVTPQTGPLAPFGEADAFVVGALETFFATQGLATGAGVSSVQILQRDTASDPALAAEAATELITQDEVDIVLVSSTPDMTNPVADTCEASGVPCISTVAPWQSWFLGRGASPVSTFRWTYHFFWGLEDVEAVFMDMWDEVDTNRRVGALWPNDPDGIAWGDPATGFLPVVAQRGYQIVDPGFYENGNTDFSAQIDQFIAEQAELLVGVPIPPDFPTFWTQANEAGFRPRLATVAKALLFPSAVEALGDLGNNLATEVWWSPTHPFTSSLTGQTASELGDAYTEQTGRPWTQPIGLVHALFEVAAAALAQADSPDDRDGIVDALSTLRLDTVCGTLDWNAGPVPNVSKIPLVGGQWRLGDAGPELVVVSNAQALAIPRASEVQPLN
jgi:branched-chain amino acid transport system substrate-binding protein